MNSLKKILEMWEEDCIINVMKLDEVSAQTPILHSKYLSLLSSAKLKLKKLEHDKNILKKKKWLWYEGKMSQEEIEAEHWEYDPLDGKKILKGDMNYYYSSDIDLQKIDEEINYWETTISAIEEIINNIKWRHSTIKNIIDFKKFESGY